MRTEQSYSAFQRFSEVLSQFTKEAETLKINPAPLRPTTYAARLRDAIRGLRLYSHPSPFSLETFFALYSHVTHDNESVFIHTKKEINTGNSKSVGFSPPPIPTISITSSADLVSIVSLLSSRAIAGPVLLAPLTHPQRKHLDTLLPQYDIALEENPDSTITLI
jgi:hypothetical protein